MNSKYTIIVAIVALTAAASLLVAGPLTPPAGPVTSSFKTLTEVEPRTAVNGINTPGALGYTYTITQPGSYYLTGNINAFLFSTAIQITSSDVTLDLNGFAIIGTGATSSPSGVIVSASVSNVTIRNGTVRGWPSYGLKLDSATGVHLMDVTAVGNGNTGFYLGSGAVLTRCTAVSNASGGFRTGADCSLTGCVATSNTGIGFSAFDKTTFLDCVAVENTTHGFSAGDGCILDRCSAGSNAGSGMILSAGCAVTSCTAYYNSIDGLKAGSGTTVTASAFRFNQSEGVSSGASCTISSCSMLNNHGVGIVTDYGSTISNCSVMNSGGDGIQIDTGNCLVLHNSCAANGILSGGAGIHILGDGNRIEANNCTSNIRGVQADGMRNTIIRNTCCFNTTDWVIAANNVIGPIIDRRTPASAAVNGFSASSSLGSTDSNANFSS